MWWWKPSSFLFCIIAPRTQTTYTHAAARARTIPAVAVNCMATFRAYMAHGVLSLQRSVRSLLISSVSRPGSVHSSAKGTPWAYYFVGWQNNTLPSSYEPNAMACDSVQNTSKQIILFFSDCFRLVAKPCCESKTPIKRALVSSVKVFGEIQVRKAWRSLDLKAASPFMIRGTLNHWKTLTARRFWLSKNFSFNVHFPLCDWSCLGFFF